MALATPWCPSKCSCGQTSAHISLSSPMTLNFMFGIAFQSMLPFESMDQPFDSPSESAVASSTISPLNSGKPFPPHFMMLSLIVQMRAFDASCVPVPLVDERNHFPTIGSLICNLKLLSARIAMAFTLDSNQLTTRV